MAECVIHLRLSGCRVRRELDTAERHKQQQQQQELVERSGEKVTQHGKLIGQTIDKHLTTWPSSNEQWIDHWLIIVHLRLFFFLIFLDTKSIFLYTWLASFFVFNHFFRPNLVPCWKKKLESFRGAPFVTPSSRSRHHLHQLFIQELDFKCKKEEPKGLAFRRGLFRAAKFNGTCFFISPLRLKKDVISVTFFPPLLKGKSRCHREISVFIYFPYRVNFSSSW